MLFVKMLKERQKCSLRNVSWACYLQKLRVVEIHNAIFVGSQVLWSLYFAFMIGNPLKGLGRKKTFLTPIRPFLANYSYLKQAFGRH